MQRRLTVAFAAMALLSVVLLGTGVLALSQVGARRGAEDQIADRIQAFVDDSEDANSWADFQRNFDFLRRVSGLPVVEVVAFDADGVISVINVPRPGPRQRGGRAEPNEPFRPNPGSLDLATLDVDEMTQLSQDKMIFLRDRGTVTGLQRLSEDQQLLFELETGETVAILGREPLPVLRQPGVRWYIISGLVVELVGIVAAYVIAKRLTRPIKEIQNATAAIARGRLDTRLTPRSNDEVGELAVSVNQMAAELQRSKTLDRQFLMSVSHDLRTPLTAMRGYGEALADRAIDDSAQAGNIIMHHADRLNRLVTDLLDLARLDANRFQFDLQVANVAVIIGRAVAGLQESADRRGINLTFYAPRTPTQASVDIDRTNQVVTNLVHNAMKYARTSVSVSVAVTESPTSASQARHVEIVVQDDGPGIASEDLPHIFDRLYTSGKRPVESENSNGLGLTIVKELVEAMGGTVAVHSPVGSGARLSVLFPTEPQQIPETR